MSGPRTGAERRLRAVGESAPTPERAVKSRAKSVTQAAAGGDRRELLVAMRSRVAKAVQDRTTLPRDLAALTRRLLEIAQEIEAIDKAVEEEDRDRSAAEDEAFDSSAV